jgi:hypothetical protein
MRFHLTLKSSNRKTGPIPVSTSPSLTCPIACPWLKSKSCYGMGGPLAIHWSAISKGERGVTWKQFLEQITQLPPNQLYRHNQAGDLRGNRKLINRTALNELVAANKGRNGFTYTHYLPETATDDNAKAIQYANQNGFTINLSANSIQEADALVKMGIGPVTVVLPSTNVAKSFKTPAGNTVTVCPATMSDKVTCASCQLCAKAQRKVIIGFASHGFRKTNIDRVLSK